jgi:hypothetical protein
MYFSVVIGGLMLIGQLAGVVPTVCFVLIPLAPTGLAAFEIPSLSRFTGRRATIARLLAVGSPLVVALVLDMSPRG